MKIININRIFGNIATWQIRNKWLLLGILVLLTVAGMAGLSRIHLISSSSGWFDKAEEIEIVTNEFEELFGNNETIGVLVEAEDVFDPEVLNMIKELGDALLLNVPYAKKVTSLTDLELTVGDEEGLAVINPFEEGIPETSSEMEKIRKLILSKQSLADKLVSRDCRETWISLSLREYPEEDEWKVAGRDPLFESGEAAVAVVTDPRWESDRYTIKAAGMPYSETEKRDFMNRDAVLRLRNGFVVMVLLLMLFLRSIRGIIVPTVTTFTGILVIFGCMGWLNIGVDSSMMTLPLLMGMALSVGYSIHLINAFKESSRQGTERKEAVVRAVEKTGWPILFTVLTTIGSMASFVVIGITPVRWLGLSCAAVVFAVYLYVILLIPILFSIGRPRPRKNGMPRTDFTGMEKTLGRLGTGILGNRRLIAVVFILATLIALPGIGKINVNIDTFQFMGMKIPYIQRLYSIAHSKLGSYLTYNITLTFQEKDAVKAPRILRNFETLQEEVGRFELTKKNGDVPKIFSLLDIIKEMYQTLNGENPEFYIIPDNRALIAQMLFLYEMSGGTDTYEWVDEGYSVLRARVEIFRFDGDEVSYELEKIESMAAELFPEAKLAIVGSAVRFATLNNKIVISELKSFFTALVIIMVLMALVFASVSTGLIGMIPNLMPVIAIGSIMGYLRIHLDMMTMIFMPMLLGIAVDDTIHFINQIKFEFERCGNYQDAIVRAFSSIGKTLAMTTIILSLTFGTYLLAPMRTTRNMGILAPLGLLIALLADYFLTPILIYWTRPFGGEKEIPENK